MDRDEKFEREGVTTTDWLEGVFNVEISFFDVISDNHLIPREWKDSIDYQDDSSVDYGALFENGERVEIRYERWSDVGYAEREDTKPSAFRRTVSHRISDPAITITEISTDKVIREEYFNNGYRHRPAHEGPAYIATSHITDVVYEEDYFENDVLHNPHGPALIRREAETGKSIIEDFYLKGERVPPFDVEASVTPGPKFDS